MSSDLSQRERAAMRRQVILDDLRRHPLSSSIEISERILEETGGAPTLLTGVDVDTSEPAGRLLANVIMSMAEWERSAIAERTREGLANARANGRSVGRPSVADRPELVAYIQELRDRGLSLQAICDQLNTEGVPTARGAAEWKPSAVQVALGYVRRWRPSTACLPVLQAR